jgi:hypothetical protein
MPSPQVNIERTPWPGMGLGLFEQHMRLWASEGRQEGHQAKHSVCVAPSHGP